MSVNDNATDINDILDIYRHLMKESNMKQCLELLKNVYCIINIVNAFNHTKYVFLSYQKCEIQPILINLHPNEYSQVTLQFICR